MPQLKDSRPTAGGWGRFGDSKCVYLGGAGWSISQNLEFHLPSRSRIASRWVIYSLPLSFLPPVSFSLHIHMRLISSTVLPMYQIHDPVRYSISPTCYSLGYDRHFQQSSSQSFIPVDPFIGVWTRTNPTRVLHCPIPRVSLVDVQRPKKRQIAPCKGYCLLPPLAMSRLFSLGTICMFVVARSMICKQSLRIPIVAFEAQLVRSR